MSELVAITYPDINRAQQVRAALDRLVAQHLLDLEDVVYVTKDASGNLELHQSINLPAVGAAAGAAKGVIWGALIGLLFLSPLAGAAIGGGIGAGTGAIAGAASASEYGIADSFVKQLSASMPPNSSAIFTLVRRATTDKVLPEIAQYGGTVLHTSLSSRDEAKLDAALAAQVSMVGQQVSAIDEGPLA
jgi:uncharacterized membrane protein